MNNVISNVKKTAFVVFAGAILLTALDYYLLRKEKKRWSITWNVSPSAFHISGKKAEQLRKSRKL